MGGEKGGRASMRQKVQLSTFESLHVWETAVHGPFDVAPENRVTFNDIVLPCSFEDAVFVFPLRR